MERSIERLRRGEVAAERLFDHQPRSFVAFCIGQTFSHGRKQVWRYSKVIKRVEMQRQAPFATR